MVKRFYSLALLCLTVLTVAAQGTVTIVADPADGSPVGKPSYDLQGRRVNPSAYRGIIVTNGKKVIHTK